MLRRANVVDKFQLHHTGIKTVKHDGKIVAIIFISIAPYRN
ncbi:hypothetical protein HMPREF1988_02028 [Porphyromonas gingivalis F0185]|nr:hypothetical protein HMPREF1988_02028 [Porphyromonas gingivalis F0185]